MYHLREVTKFGCLNIYYLKFKLRKRRLNHPCCSIAVVQREEDMTPFFNYELTTVSTSLFKDNYLQKTDKAQLQIALKNLVEPLVLNSQATYVLDDGALIHA